MREKIQKALSEIIGEEVELEHPVDASHGDYSTSIALVSAKKEKKSPLALANELVSKMRDAGELRELGVEKIEVAPPGFINFWLSEKALLEALEETLDRGYGGIGGGRGKKIIIEYTDPNPFKEFHIGHVFTNTVGEALSRLLEAEGAEVKRANYQGDVGLHVAKAIWGMQKKLQGEGVSLDDIERLSLTQRSKWLGECYALGNRAFEEDPSTGSGQASEKNEIKDLNKKVYELDPAISELYEKGRQWSLDAFEVLYKRLGTKFDFYYFERQTGEEGGKIVKEGLASGIFKEDKGAIIFPGEKHGLHNRVFINSQDLPTYEAKDLGLAFMKYKDFPYDESYIVTGNEVTEYFRVVNAALSKVNPGLGKKAHHIGHGMVRLSSGKLSSRTGDVITGEWFLDEAKNRLQSKYKMTDDVAEQVAVGAVKYALLKSSIGKDIIFDFDTSLSLEGDSGPYLQYTFARTQSVLAKAKMGEISGACRFAIRELGDVGVNPEEEAMLRTFYKFPEVVQEAAENFAPNALCTFLYDFATKYNKLYNTHRILEAESEEAKNLRLALTKVTGNILKMGLNLLGIEAPEKM